MRYQLPRPVSLLVLTLVSTLLLAACDVQKDTRTDAQVSSMQKAIEKSDEFGKRLDRQIEAANAGKVSGAVAHAQAVAGVREAYENLETLEAEREKLKNGQAKNLTSSMPDTQTASQKYMQTIANQVADDAVEQYDMAKRNGATLVDMCVHAGFVSAAYLQAKDESNYRVWKSMEKADCARAGMPQ
ncbi:MAG: hypothetical protein WCA45_04955 [Thiobacillaceae bacterium]